MHMHDLEALEKNPIWQEIKTSMEEVKKAIQVELQTLDPFQSPTDIARGQGKVWMIDTILIDLIKDIKYDITNENEET